MTDKEQGIRLNIPDKSPEGIVRQKVADILTANPEWGRMGPVVDLIMKLIEHERKVAYKEGGYDARFSKDYIEYAKGLKEQPK